MSRMLTPLQVSTACKMIRCCRALYATRRRRGTPQSEADRHIMKLAILEQNDVIYTANQLISNKKVN